MSISIVPSSVNDLYTFYTTNQREKFHELLLRVSIAAAICLAVAYGSPIVAAVCTTLSLPATALAAGALLFKYGAGLLKAGIVAKQAFLLLRGAAVLFVGWKLLDGYKDFRGYLETPVQGVSPMQRISNSLANMLGY